MKVFIASLFLFGFFVSTAHADRNILWDKVHNQCEVNYTTNSLYAPCALVDENNGYVYYKVDNDNYQYLLLPLAKITGVEDPQLLADNLPPYLYMAWWGRDLVSEKTGRKVKEKNIAIAINALNSRTQDQLHLHISCLAPAVRTALDSVTNYSTTWAQFPLQLQGNTYNYRKVTLDELKQKNLFKEINDKVVADGKQMKYTTIALINLDSSDFLLLETSGNDTTAIAAETLQDHTCAIAGS
ncbi:CDP-diacylglycerol diphosphatase [Kosakonia radicincitans]|uniref:CDP-diacylglycerol diphosphatase n=1 Tax=Kosakonia radicincitans TaxID=283686 RepID=UPI0005C2AFFD|nr:CDP-diacylglycerol diphosphatase [Kosakonia radicincitans]KIS41382.1 CDP-diacylglycerol pyrophosphatase family protein [Kosakonia radicincitans YD4]